MAEFCKETIYHLFGSTSVLSFTSRFSYGKTHNADCCFVLESYWYTQVSSPVTMPQTRGDLPPSNSLSAWGAPVHPTPLLLFTQVMGHPTPKQSSRMRVRLPDEIFMVSCISAYVILGSFLIRDYGVTVVATQPQRSSSSSVLAPDMNCLNHLKTVALGGD